MLDNLKKKTIVICNNRKSLDGLVTFLFLQKNMKKFCCIRIICYLCPRFGEKSGLTESIRYYFALSQNAQETIWNKKRSEVIETWGVRYGIPILPCDSNAFTPNGVVYSYKVDGVPFLGMPQA